MLWVAFLIGFMGSLHCLGMCGPIAISIPVNSKKQIPFLINRLLYNFGRLFTYGILGAIFGLFGFGIYLADKQQVISIAIGVGILIVLVLSYFNKGFFNKFDPLSKLAASVKKSFKHLFKKRGNLTSFLIGAVNGLLPCGLVYMALASSIVTASVLDGILFMVVFGLGTFPMMLFVSFSKSIWKNKITMNFNRLIPVFMLVMALLFIARGMNLGIPYLSPQLRSNNPQDTSTYCAPE